MARAPLLVCLALVACAANHHEPAVRHRDVAVEAPENRVVAEQVRKRLRVGEVVDADDVELDVARGRGRQ